MRRFRFGVLAVLVLLPGTSADAHVEIKPKRAPAGSEVRLTLEVENERPASTTRRIDMQVPDGVTSIQGRSLRGWKLRVRTSDGTPRRAILTAPRGRELSGHEAGRFRLTVGLPDRPEARLTFKVLQTYASGEVVRWIGPPGSSEPAPTLRLTAAKEPPPERPPATETERESEPGAAADSSSEEGNDDGSTAAPIIAGIAAVALAVMVGGLIARRRNRRRPNGVG